MHIFISIPIVKWKNDLICLHQWSRYNFLTGRNARLRFYRALPFLAKWAVTLGSLTCGEGGNLSTQDLSFIYVSSAGRVGCEFMHPTQPTDAPSSRRSSRSHFYTLGFPRGWDMLSELFLFLNCHNKSQL